MRNSDYMKKILFISRSMNTGGVERALVNQLYAIDKEKYDISLFLFSDTGALMEDIPKQVKLIKGNFLLRCIGKTREESKETLLTYIVRNTMAVAAKIVGSKRIFSILFFSCKRLKGYDYAISYQNDVDDRSLYYGCNLFALKKVDADKKIAWIHADYSYLRKTVKWDEKLLSKFDAVVNVSGAMKSKFNKLGIIESERSYTVYNRLLDAEIKQKSVQIDEIEAKDDLRFTLITVCRLDKLKSVYELCVVANKLRDKGLNYKWYFCGTGPENDRCKQFIRECKLEDHVCFLGEKSNPYPYIRRADLFVSGSVLETFGLSIAEALILNTPVVAMQYDAVTEIIKNGENGIVVDNFDDMADVIIRIIENDAYYKILKKKARLLKDYNKMNQEQMELLLGGD